MRPGGRGRRRPGIVWARSDGSCARARGLGRTRAREARRRRRGRRSPRPRALAEATLRGRGGRRGPRRQGRAARASSTSILGDDAILATTTSSLSVARARPPPAAGPSASSALHVFNPVPKMDAGRARVPAAGERATRKARAHALCEALGKTAVEVPDTPGFVVNRLLFPYLFEPCGCSSAPAWSRRRSTRA